MYHQKYFKLRIVQTDTVDELLVSIRDNSIKPDHIIVTGDMAWYGRKTILMKRCCGLESY